MYNYLDLKAQIFLPENQIPFLKQRKKARGLLHVAGAFLMEKALESGDSWLNMAFIDRLVEIEEVEEVGGSSRTPGQHRLFIKGRNFDGF